MIDLYRWEDEGGRVADEADAEGARRERERRLRKAMQDSVDDFRSEVDQRVQVCLDRHGFYLARGPGDCFWVYVPVGNHADRSPLTWARRSWDWEVEAWREGDFESIARGLLAEGRPVRGVAPLAAGAQRPRGLWGRLVAALRRFKRGSRHGPDLEADRAGR